MTINTQKLRDLIRRAVPLPWQLATSNSWRRILSRDGAAVCSPLNQSDGHPDLHFPGGAEGPTAKLLIEAANALPTLLDHIDAQATEIERLRGLVSEMANNDTYETEYDGRMYSICHGCGAQDGEPHRRPDCLYVRARAALSGESK